MKLLCISMDTVRADHLSGLGYPRPTTPNLDRIASQGALFSNAFASDIPTQPAHTAVFTGRRGINTEIVSHYHPPARLADQVPWMPRLMQAAGRPTAAVDHLFVMKDWFIRGYDDYMPPPGRSRAPAETVNELAFPWLEAHADDDFFMFLHYWDAHIPYLPPEPFRTIFAGETARKPDPLTMQTLRTRPTFPLFKRNHYDHHESIASLEWLGDLYDAELAYLDEQLGRLFAHLERLGILDDTMIVIFGDHGEVMTEHDSWFDHAGLYDSVTHVPVIIRHPATITPTRIDALIQPIDLFPTVLEAAGLPLPERIDGRSLWPLLGGERETHYEWVPLSECTWQASRAIRTSTWKFIRSYGAGVYPRPDVELYHLPSDPDEQENVADRHEGVVMLLDALLQTWLEGQLQGRIDPMAQVVADGLPAVARLQGVIDEDEREAARAALEIAGAAVEVAAYVEPDGPAQTVVEIGANVSSSRAIA